MAGAFVFPSSRTALFPPLMTHHRTDDNVSIHSGQRRGAPLLRGAAAGDRGGFRLRHGRLPPLRYVRLSGCHGPPFCLWSACLPTRVSKQWGRGGEGMDARLAGRSYVRACLSHDVM